MKSIILIRAFSSRYGTKECYGIKQLATSGNHYKRFCSALNWYVNVNRSWLKHSTYKNQYYSFNVLFSNISMHFKEAYDTYSFSLRLSSSISQMKVFSIFTVVIEFSLLFLLFVFLF